MRFFRRGAHHQTGFRPTVDDLAAAIKRQAWPSVWRREIRDGREWFVGHMPVRIDGPASGAFLAIAAPSGIATLPAIYNNESEATA